MKIVLAATENRLADAWEKAFAGVDGVSVHRGSIFDVACDAVVSPANSYGFMDGGIDALYLDRFGVEVQTRLRRLILDRHHGELLVGSAEVVETGDPAQPFLIAAPTMRVPMVLGPETITPTWRPELCCCWFGTASCPPANACRTACGPLPFQAWEPASAAFRPRSAPSRCGQRSTRS
ncbi:hypothetical protein KXS07_20065 [Inquilinus limosus]|uniref:hypothetical protein n=1 Tax=Inquilinus limosus TaxID=171674 RepID=UPI003F16B952